MELDIKNIVSEVGIKAFDLNDLKVVTHERAILLSNALQKSGIHAESVIYDASMKGRHKVFTGIAVNVLKQNIDIKEE